MKINLTQAKQYTFAFCLIGLIAMISNTAFAAPENTAIDQVLCKVVKLLSGPIGKGIATVALVVLGIGLFAGKLNWPMALITAVGIGVIFGAPTVVDYLAGGEGGTGCGS